MIIRLALFIIMLSSSVLGISPNLHALTIAPDQQFQFAENLYNARQYLQAAQEYQRFAFFFPKDTRRRLSVYKAAEAFLMAKDPISAADLFREIADAGQMDSLAVEAYFMLAECRLQMNAPTLAAVDLNNLILLSEDIAVRDRACYRLGWLHMGQTDWPAAKRAFSRISAAGRGRYAIDDLQRELDRSSRIATRNPTLAGILSIIPGAGQLYCNRYEDALIAFMVNIGLFWAAHDAFNEDQYALGGLLSFVGLGFYAGNIYSAVSDAHKFNQLQKNIFTEELKQQIVIGETVPGSRVAAPLFLSLHVPF